MRTWSMKPAPHTAVEPQFYPPHWKKPHREADGTPSSVRRGLWGADWGGRRRSAAPLWAPWRPRSPAREWGHGCSCTDGQGRGGHSLVVVILHKLLELFDVAHGLQVLLHVGQGGEVVCRRRRPRGFSLSPSLSLPVSGPHPRRD